MKTARLISCIVTLAVLAGGLAGCATTARLVGQQQQFGPVSLLEQRTGNILMTVCQAETKVTGVPVDPKKDKPILGGSGRYRKGVLLQGCAIVKDFYQRLEGDWADETSSRDARALFEDGVVLSDAACFNWVVQLDSTRRASATAAGFTSGVTTLTNVVQAQTGVEASALAIVAAVGKSVSSGFSNFDAQYMLSPNLPDVFQALQQYRLNTAEDYLARSDLNTKATAVRYLQYYERSCTSLGVQQFLTKAILNAGDQTGAPKVSLAVEAALRSAAGIVAGELHVSDVLSRDDLVYLVLVWEVLPDKKKDYVDAKATAKQADTDATAAEAIANGTAATQPQKDAATKARQKATDAATKRDALKAAYEKVAKQVETTPGNRELDDPGHAVKKKLFQYAAARTKAAPPEDLDSFAPTTNGVVAKAKLQTSELHGQLRDDAIKLFEKLQAG